MENKIRAEFSGITPASLQKNRDQCVRDLRKRHRDHLLSQKRFKSVDCGHRPHPIQDVTESAVNDHLVSLLKSIQQSNAEAIVQTLSTLRLILSGMPAPRQHFITNGGVDLLCRCLEALNSDIQYGAAWCLTNLSADKLGDAGPLSNCIPFLLRLLKSPDPRVQGQCAWCIGNLAADSDQIRTAVVKAGAIAALSMMVETVPPQGNGDDERVRPICHAAFALCNIFQDLKYLHHGIRGGVISRCVALLLEVELESLAKELCWILFFISRGGEMACRHLVKCSDNLISLLVSRMSSTSPGVVIPIVRTLSNFIFSCDALSERVMAEKCFTPAILHCLFSSDEVIVKESAYVVSNLLSVFKYRAHILNDNDSLCEGLVNLLNDDCGDDVKREIFHAVGNAVLSSEGSRALVEAGVIPCVVRLIANSDDAEMLAVAIVIIESSLSFHPSAITEARSSGCGEILQRLQGMTVKHPHLAARATAIIEKLQLPH